MNVLFDTNVVLDALLDRDPWAEAAVALFDRVESGDLVGHLGATTVTTVHYIASRNVGANAAEEMMRDLLRLFEVAPVNRAVLEGALGLGFTSFEDAVLHEAGRLVGAGALTTRDPEDFLKASLRLYAPDALVAALNAGVKV
ncbi:MAG: PIN domain-containing protein [Rubrobacteraceae bacterium]|nr:PIN domain-containing protein [Rubrobacteraceae bacterium]